MQVFERILIQFSKIVNFRKVHYAIIIGLKCQPFHAFHIMLFSSFQQGFIGFYMLVHHTVFHVIFMHYKHLKIITLSCQ
ncbi:hypothetical protein ACNKXS_13070 [Christiangramia marina]|uniref:hypothetical protein n=1 Tax=Christiangramia marina TaxID=409436 RepID=UPI003AA91788